MLVVKVDSGVKTVKLSNLYQVVPSREKFVMFSGVMPEDTISSEDDGSTRIHIPKE